MPGENQTQQASQGTPGSGTPDPGQVDDWGLEEGQQGGNDGAAAPEEGTSEGGEGTAQERGAEPSSGEGAQAPQQYTPEEVQALQSQMAELQGTIENLNRQVQFYQTQYNELVTSAGQGVVQPPSAPGQPQGAQAVPGGQGQGRPGGDGQGFSFQPPPVENLPAGIIGPEKVIRDASGNITAREGGWDDQEQMAQYFDHRATTITSHALEQAYSEVLQPVFERINKTLTALQEHVVKTAFPDYEEVVKGVWDDIFVLDQNGQVVGYKNPALLKYFQDQAFPQLAVYQHGLSKRAPQQVKEGTQKATQQVLKQLGKKPKGPTQVETSTHVEGLPDLDWDTPPSQAEQILAKRGIIKPSF